jgi:hypothetical protein
MGGSARAAGHGRVERDAARATVGERGDGAAWIWRSAAQKRNVSRGKEGRGEGRNAESRALFARHRGCGGLIVGQLYLAGREDCSDTRRVVTRAWSPSSWGAFESRARSAFCPPLHLFFSRPRERFVTIGDTRTLHVRISCRSMRRQ